MKLRLSVEHMGMPELLQGIMGALDEAASGPDKVHAIHCYDELSRRIYEIGRLSYQRDEENYSFIHELFLGDPSKVLQIEG